MNALIQDSQLNDRNLYVYLRSSKFGPLPLHQTA